MEEAISIKNINKEINFLKEGIIKKGYSNKYLKNTTLRYALASLINSVDKLIFRHSDVIFLYKKDIENLLDLLTDSYLYFFTKEKYTGGKDKKNIFFDIIDKSEINENDDVYEESKNSVISSAHFDELKYFNNLKITEDEYIKPMIEKADGFSYNCAFLGSKKTLECAILGFIKVTTKALKEVDYFIFKSPITTRMLSLMLSELYVRFCKSKGVVTEKLSKKDIHEIDMFTFQDFYASHREIFFDESTACFSEDGAFEIYNFLYLLDVDEDIPEKEKFVVNITSPEIAQSFMEFSLKEDVKKVLGTSVEGLLSEGRFVKILKNENILVYVYDIFNET